MKALFKGLLLMFIFFFAFLFTTAILDTIERYIGYYKQGINESNEVGKYNVFL